MPLAPQARNLISRPRRRDDGGFTLVELMVAMTIFTVMIVGFGMLLSASLKSYRFSRARTAGETLASGELDKVRQVTWSSLGTTSGNPPGTLVADEDVTVGTMTFHVKRFVELVDDNVPTYGFNTGANYKRVVITVSSPAMTKPIVYETLVAPPTQPSLYSAAVRAHVSETCGKTDFAPGWNVTIANGPSPTRVGVTDTSNNVKFSGLIPTNDVAPGDYYDLSASLSGWAQMPAAPVDSHFTLDPGQTPTPSLTMFKPATVTIHLKDLMGQPVTTPFSLDAKDWTGASMPTISGQSADGTLTLSTFGSGSFVACKDYTFSASSMTYTTTNPGPSTLTPPNYPADGNVDVDVIVPIPPRTKTTFHLVDKVTGAPLAGVAGTIDPTNPLEPTRSFTTAADGTVTFDLLPDTFHILTNAISGYWPGDFTYTVQVPTPTTPPTLPSPVDTDLKVDPWKLQTVALTLTDSFSSTPVANTTVQFAGGPQGTVTATTDTSGIATVSLVQTTYTVTIPTLDPMYQAYTASTFTVSGTTTSLPLSVARMGAVTFTANNSSVTPVTPMAGVGLRISTSTGTLVANLTTATDGTIATYLTPGSYKVDVNPTPTGFGAYTTQNITVAQGPAAVAVNLQQFGTLNVQLRDAATTNPITSPLTPKSVNFSGGPSGSGTISLTSGAASKQLLAGTYTITRAADSTYQAYTGTVTVTAAGTVSFNVDLFSNTTVTAKFKATNSATPTPGNTGSGSSVKITGPSGTFTLSLNGSGGTVSQTIKPGVYTVTLVTAPTGLPTLVTQSITVTAGTTYPIQFSA